MLRKVSLQPGINKEGTAYSAEGGWYDSDKIRFRKGRAEKIGGWVKLTADTIIGFCRNIHNWTTLNRDNYMGLGTNVKAYLEFGQAFYDITPQMYKSTTYLDDDATTSGNININAAVTSGSLLVVDSLYGYELIIANATGAGSISCTRGALGTEAVAHETGDAVFEIPKLSNPISPAIGSSVVLINAPAHGASEGDYITFLYIQTDFSSTTTRAGLLSGYSSSTSTQGFRITRILNSDNYEISAGGGALSQPRTITAAMTGSDVTITLSSNATSVYDLLRVDEEYVKLTGAHTDGEPKYTCLRGQYGSIAESHDIGEDAREMFDTAADATSNTFCGGEVFITYDIASTTTSYADGSGWSAGTWGGRPSTFVSSTLDGPGGSPNALVAGGSTVSLVDSSSFGSSGTVLIDQELMTYTGNSGSSAYNLTGLGRGVLGTTDVLHTTGSTAFDVTSSWTAWNQVTTLPVNVSDTSLRIWNMDNYGEDLILAPRDGKPYYWNASRRTSDALPQKIINSAAATTTNTGAYISSPIPLSSLGLSTDPGHGYVPDFVRQIMVFPFPPIVVAFGCSETLPDPDSSTGATSYNPMLVRWSNPDLLGSWLPTEAIGGAGGTILLTGSYIVAAAKSKREVLIWTDEAVYQMRYVTGGSVFSFNELSTGLSIVGPYAYSVSGDRIFWMDDRNFYVYDGSISIIPCSVLSYVFDDFNYSEREKIFAARNSKFGECTWFYPSSDSITLDRYVSYNYVESNWSIGSMSRMAWSDSGIRQYPHASAADSSIAGSETSVIYTHENGNDADGYAFTAYIESGYMDIDDGDQVSFVSRIIPDVYFSSGNSMDIKLTPKQFPNSSAGTVVTSSVTSSTGESRVRLRGRQFSIRFETTGSGVGWTLGDSRVDIRPDGKR